MDKGMLMIIRKYASLRSFMINKDKRATLGISNSMYASKSIATTEIKRNKRKSRFNSFSLPFPIENKELFIPHFFPIRILKRINDEYSYYVE